MKRVPLFEGTQNTLHFVSKETRQTRCLQSFSVKTLHEESMKEKCNKTWETKGYWKGKEINEKGDCFSFLLLEQFHSLLILLPRNQLTTKTQTRRHEKPTVIILGHNSLADILRQRRDVVSEIYNHFFLPILFWENLSLSYKFPVILVSRVQYSCRPFSRTQDIQGWKRRRHRLIWDNPIFETYFSSSFELLLTRTLCRKTSVVGELFKA